jgi:hypothetical protein
MRATLKMNGMGHIHIWFRKVKVEQVDRFNFHGNGQESCLYLQDQNDIDDFLDDMDPDDRDALLDAQVVDTFIADEYKNK